MVSDFEEKVKLSFSACKNDISSLKSENKQLTEEIFELKSETKGLKIAIEMIKDIAIINKEKPQIISNPIQIKEEIEIPMKKESKKKDSYEALLEFKAKSNKRELLKQKILSMIGEGGINLSELKFMFVEHFKYTSKATFYNYLKELELERQLKIERENSKNYVFLYSIKKEI